MSVHNRFMIEMYIVCVPFSHVPLKYCFPHQNMGNFCSSSLGKHISPQLRGLMAWLQCFYHVSFFGFSGSWLLLEMKIQVKPQRVPCQPHPAKCSFTTLEPQPCSCIGAGVFYQASLTTPKPHLLLLHKRGCVLPSFPKHPR